MATFGLIVPAYGHWDYVLKTVDSFFQHTPGDNRCYIIDDCSPEPLPADVVKQRGFATQFSEIESNTLYHRFATHSGLTRSWNLGTRLGTRLPYWNADYVVCGNSDILFTPNWHKPLVDALEKVDLVGPLTNAPGRVFKQNVLYYMKHYKLTDDAAYLSGVAKRLSEQYAGVIKPMTVNGFFFMAKASTFRAHAFNNEDVFDPAEPMNDAAYQLQTRWKKAGLSVGLVPASFIWHYRSVSRGTRGLLGQYGKGAFRPKQ